MSEPIIEDKDADDEGTPRLSFPKVRDAFVPQAFKVTRQTGKSRRLEDESTWAGLTRRNDLGAFLLSYLSSPYSTETPLLILGHPGSGKSLLTTILSAQLMSKQFTAIRVPLREVNADADIVTQIEEAIRRITGVSFDSWIKLSALFRNCPPLVILDGYDELLQASGQVFASYIKDAQRFQEREAEQGRPLRIIITSRVTLIDKAAVPVGSTIVRLLEFDRHQRECWSGIWNKANVGYFRDARIEKFVLPDEAEKDAEKILNLAEQPLLLLMLALYDSQGNQLRNCDNVSSGITGLYLFDPAADRTDDLESVTTRLSAEGYDLGLHVAIAQLLALAEQLPSRLNQFISHGKQTLEQVVRSRRVDQIESVCGIIARCFEHGDTLLARNRYRFRHFREIFDPPLIVRLSEDDARSARIVFGLATRLRDFEWIGEFSGRLLEIVSKFEIEKWGMLRSQEGLLLLREIAGSGHLSRLLDRGRVHASDVERMFHPDRLLDLSERNPEGALVYLHVLRELGGRRLFEQFFERNMRSDFFSRMTQSTHLFELSELNPDGAIAYLQLLRQIGGRRNFQRFLSRDVGLEFAHRMIEPRRLLDFSERDPEGTLNYLRTFRELIGSQNFLRLVREDMGPDVFNRIFEPRYLSSLSERNPEGALAYLQILWELDGEQSFRRFVKQDIEPSLFEETIHPRHLLELSERNPEGALSYLPILQELGGKRIFQRHIGDDSAGAKFFESMIRHLLEVSERSPDGALAYLRILRELEGDRIFQRFIDRDDAPDFLSLGRLRQTLRRGQHGIQMLGFWVTLARVFQWPRVVLSLSEALSLEIRDQSDFKSRVSTLPISSLTDLRWLADRALNPELKSFVDELFV